MFVIAHLLALITAFFRLSITPVKTTADPNDPEDGVSGQQGAMPSTGNIVNLINNLKSNAGPAFGNFLLSIVGGAAATYTGTQLTGGFIRRGGQAVATTDSTDTATNIVNAIPGAVVGQTFPVMIANLSSAALTVAAGTGVTLTGTAAISRFSTRLYLATVTGSAAVTMTNCFEFSSGVSPASLV